jgi:hypothetical protein
MTRTWRLPWIFPWRKPGKKVGALWVDAKASLADLLQFEDLRVGQWYIRLSVKRCAQGWGLLATDSLENDRTIKEKLALSDGTVTDLVLAFVGDVNWRGSNCLMASMQYFRTGHETGLLFGSHLTTDRVAQKLQTKGGFLIFGSCQNIWI